MHKVWDWILVVALSLLALGCGTTDKALKEQGYSAVYLQGFHDGRHSGMREAGNNWEHYIRDHDKFEKNDDYKTGWLAGEAEGKSLQAQAQAIGNAAGGAYTGYRVGKEYDKAKPHPGDISKDVMKGVDTSNFKYLGK